MGLNFVAYKEKKAAKTSDLIYDASHLPKTTSALKNQQLP